jgi:hypothetical protein
LTSVDAPSADAPLFSADAPLSSVRQWKLELPPKFVVKKTNLREIRETLSRAQRIVMTHERSDEFGPMLESIMTDLKAQTSSSFRRN